MAKKKFYRPLLYGALKIIQGFFMLLPFRYGFAFAGWLGKMAFYLIPREREKTLAHLKIAFGREKSDKELIKLGAEVFKNYGYTAAELSLADKIIKNFTKIATFSGREHLDRAFAEGKGIVMVGAHFGNWEMTAGFLCLLGYPGVALGRRIYFDRYNQEMLALREKMNLKTIDRDSPSAPREAFKALKENKIVGFVVDQDVDSIHGVFVEFFGRPAYSASAPVRFAMKTGAPLIPIFMIREGLKHRDIIHPPMELTRTGDEEKDVVINTQKWVSLQEQYIRQYPHLWAWNHKRWKTIPKQPISIQN